MVQELTNVSNYTKTDRNSAGAWLTHSTGQQPPPRELSQNRRQGKDWPATDWCVSQQDAVLVGGQSKEGRVHRESELHKGSKGGEDGSEMKFWLWAAWLWSGRTDRRDWLSFQPCHSFMTRLRFWKLREKLFKQNKRLFNHFKVRLTAQWLEKTKLPGYIRVVGCYEKKKDRN